ncbi:MAG: hypothetical protein QXH03_07120, partial [Candidatus Bathyarchaeia archaeon]
MPGVRIVARPARAVKSREGYRATFPKRPQVLSSMPLSCNLLFDVLSVWAKDGVVHVGLKQLQETTHLSLSQVYRALKRLEAAKLIMWTRSPGRGGTSHITLLWQVIHRTKDQEEEQISPEASGAKFSPHARDTLS